MDAEDRYFKKFYPNFYSVYKHESPISRLFKERLPLFLSRLPAKSYGIVDATADGPINKTIGAPFPEDRPSVGMISYTLPEDPGGHWGGWVYLPRKKMIFLYDSMMNRGKSDFSSIFKKILHQKYPGYRVSLSGCGCRPRSMVRQPTGGFVEDDTEIMTRVINAQTPLSPSEYRRIVGYQSQHQYCFAEALLFIEDVLSGRSPRCERGQLPYLIEIKKFIRDKLHDVNTENFMYVYNPETRRKNKIV